MKTRLPQSFAFALDFLLLLTTAVTATEFPNIVFILADDLGYGDVSANNPDAGFPTPAMDRLASEGMRFTDAHSPSAVCTPTRYGILTGRYCWRTRLKRGVLWGIDSSLMERAPAIHHSASGMFAIRDGKWKLIAGTGSGGRQAPKGKVFGRPFQLYDLEADPSETTNLIETHPEIASRLETALKKIREDGRSR